MRESNVAGIVAVDIPCPACGERPLWKRDDGAHWCNTCGDDVISPSIWQRMGIATVTIEQVAELVEGRSQSVS